MSAQRLILATLTLFWLACAVNAEDKTPDYQHLPKDVEAILAKPDRLELFSLDPAMPDEKPKNGFHEWKVLGSTVVKDAKTQAALVAALQKGIAESNVVASCFDPRHGLRATQGGKTVDLVICFRCRSIEVHRGDQRSFVWVTVSPQPALDKVLKDANVPLAKKVDAD